MNDGYTDWIMYNTSSSIDYNSSGNTTTDYIYTTNTYVSCDVNKKDEGFIKEDEFKI